MMLSQRLIMPPRRIFPILNLALGIDIFTTYELMKELVNRADGFKEAFE